MKKPANWISLQAIFIPKKLTYLLFATRQTIPAPSSATNKADSGLSVPIAGSLKSKYENTGLRPEIKDKLL